LPDGARTDRSAEIVLLKQISGGTFARVYLAEATGGDITRLVAVKVLREQWVEIEEIVQRTQDEARMLARLRHPNIVRVEGLVKLKGQPAIVMEFVEGLDCKNLAETAWAKGNTLSPRAVWELGRRVASALDAAWRKVPYGLTKPLQLVHRDIKPSNLMLSVEGQIKVLDFGTARANLEERQAHTKATRLGSLKYMSPERRDGERGEHGSDVYALGLSLIELLSRQWLPVLPLRPDKHDAAIADAIAAIADTGLGDGEWDQAARTLLGELCAYEEADRPTAQAVSKVLGAFEDESDGQGLERMAETHVEPAVSARRLDSAGDLEGQRIALSLTTSTDRPKHQPKISDQPTLHDSPPAALGWDDHSEHTIQDGRIFQGVDGPPPLGPPAVASQPPPYTPPRPSPPVAAPAPVEPRGRAVLPMIVAGLGGALAVILVLGLAIAVMVDTGDEPAPTLGPATVKVKPTDEPEPAVDPQAEPEPAVFGTAFEIRLEPRRFQWVKLLSPDGDLIIKGNRDGLEGELLPGAYMLAFKRVGQTSTAAPFQIGEEATTWRCEAADGGRTACFDDLAKDGQDPILVIKP
jgi:serine/threonine protein kinase